MRESRPYGSERGAFSNGRPYRDQTVMLLAMAPGNRRHRERVDGATTFALKSPLVRPLQRPSGWRRPMGRITDRS